MNIEVVENWYLKVYKLDLHEYLKNILSKSSIFNKSAQVHLTIALAPRVFERSL